MVILHNREQYLFFLGIPDDEVTELKEWLNHGLCRQYFVPNFWFCTNFVPNGSRFIKIYVKDTLGKKDSGGRFLREIEELKQADY